MKRLEQLVLLTAWGALIAFLVVHLMRREYMRHVDEQATTLKKNLFHDVEDLLKALGLLHAKTTTIR